MQEESISLYFQQGSSDKVYHAQLQKVDGGFVVNFQYGRRGAALTAGTKTTSGPVDYATAKKAYDKIVKEKVAKGYSPGEAGTAFAGTALEERFTGIVPMLLNPVCETEARELLGDIGWVMQEKFDGHRRLIRATEAEVLGINRKGLVVPLPAETVQVVQMARKHFPLTLDGEMVGDRFIAFDVLEHNGVDLRLHSYGQRLRSLAEVAEAMRLPATTVLVAQTFRSEVEKTDAYRLLKEQNKEGAVFKRLDAPYAPGRPASGGYQLKRKFTHSATVIVEKVHSTKRSVCMAMTLADGSQVAVGNVTIPANQAIPPAGSLIEVEYLYAFAGGSLFQPQFKGVRDDVGREACGVAQLILKAEPDGEDERDAV